MTSVHDVTYDPLRSAAGASDFAMVDIMKIGGVTGWLSAMAGRSDDVAVIKSHLGRAERACDGRRDDSSLI